MAENVVTQVPGTMWKVMVKPGDEVKAGDTLFIMEIMKTEVPHTAATSGTVKQVNIEEGQEGLDEGELVIIIA